MSLLDTASLIVTPNAYKEGKLYSVIPSDGSGDMSVVRATDATRVNSAGLVELVPYNLTQYSEDLTNSYWAKQNTTITSNAIISPSGILNADLVTENTTNGDHAIFDVVSYFVAGTTYTISFYAKANGRTKIELVSANSGTCPTGRFDLVAQTATATNTSFNAQIESVGNGWFRCSVSRVAPNTGLDLPYFAMVQTFGIIGYAGDGTSGMYLWGMQSVEGSTAKDYQKTETRLNIPRLDYSNGTCPSLLVEPQRTNLLTWSSSFDNAAWVKNNASIVITPNYSISPSGNTDAQRIVFPDGASQISQAYTITNNTISVYIKGVAGETINVGFGGGVGNIATLTGEWQRIVTSDTTGSFIFIGTWGSTARDIQIWGAQLEVGSYATSYIPTTSAAVTRNADVISKTGISSLIGQTEGTLFVDVDFTHNNKGLNEYLAQVWVDNSNRILLYRSSNAKIGAYILRSASVIYNFESLIDTNGKHKIAFAYKSGDIVFYIDGVAVNSSTSTFTAFSSLSNYDLGIHNASGLSIEIGDYPYSSAALWKQRLTNTQLASLTTL